MIALAGEIERMSVGRRVTAVIGVLADKDASGMLDAIVPQVETIIATAPDSPRALDAAALADIARDRGARSIETVDGVREAVERARISAGEDGLVIVTGSVHTVADAISEPGERVVTSL
jgi:dihydrofolate synthase/folylpolyglutamate synthase